MTEILFGSIGFILIGYFIGKLFKNLNPFLMLLGGFFLLFMSPAFIELDNDYYTVCFVFGAILNFSRPVTYIRDLFGSFSLRRAGANYVANIEEQKQQAESELYAQKHQVEEDLRRQKQEAEQDIQRQRREVEEEIRRKKSSKNSSTGIDQDKHSAMKILGLKGIYTLSELKKAYRRESNKYHPDKGSNQPEHIKKLMESKFKEVLSAYNYLEGLVK